MSQDDLKRAVASAALERIRPHLRPGAVIGVGTGSTADCFIDVLCAEKASFAAAVASSERTASRLTAGGVKVVELNDVEVLPVYIDGADEVTEALHMIKGGGGALTREKIVAAVASEFVCIVDQSKVVPTLGGFPLPVEVIPMARAYVARSLFALAGKGASVALRKTVDGVPFITDNGNVILDVRGWMLIDPLVVEDQINAIVGVVTNGLFAHRKADVVLVGSGDGIRIIGAAS